MSDEEENIFCSYGTPLEPYDEDAFPKRKPITIEDQIATDAHGRRRFHGAFTGGFSAGFFNTVGSLEGWTPSEFKSSRQEKAKQYAQKPEDFMDDEDVGEYGIAPQTIRATTEYSTVKKRPRQVFSDGPIPGEPVLDTLLTSGNETVGYMLLRNMGIEDKVKNRQQELSGKVYGCEMPTTYQISDDIRDKEYSIPDIYVEYLNNPKINTSGLGYQGLEKPHVHLFQKPNFTVRDKNNKKMSIGGQAFGVGAFEDDDDDIYAKEDLNNYDFELTKEKETSKKNHDVNKLLFGLFKSVKIPLLMKKSYPPPSIPHSFTGIHKVRKSRFEPIQEHTVSRSKINPAIRARYLGEEVPETTSTPVVECKQESSSRQNTSTPVVECKQELSSRQNRNSSNSTIDTSISRQTFDPSCLLTNKFVSASQQEDISNILEPVRRIETEHGTQEMREAAKIKMYGPLTRVTCDWHPCALLCKRFNVPEPFVDRPNTKDRKRTKNLIFEYQKHTDEPELKPGISIDSEFQMQEESLRVDVKVEEDDSVQEIPIDTVLPSTSRASQLEASNMEENIEVKKEKTEEVPSLDITDRIGVEDKVDLYKAVFFDSSSESEDETDKSIEQKTEDKIEEFKSTILSDDLIPKIKPLKEGILSNINFSAFNRNKQPLDKTVTDKVEESALETPTVSSYGPQLPIKKEDVISKTHVAVEISSDSDDCWVEKDERNKVKKKSKHKKKDKKDKHKKNKHKKSKH